MTVEKPDHPSSAPEAGQSGPAQPSANPLQPLFDELRAVNASSGLVGAISPGRGVRGRLLYFVKLVIRRLLTWYTRPLHEYQAIVTRALNQTTRLLESSLGATNVLEVRLAGITEELADIAGQLRLAELQYHKMQRSLGREQAVPARPAQAAIPLWSSTRELPFGVNLVGHLDSEKGVGEALRASSRSLSAARVPLAVADFSDPGSLNIERGPERSESAPYRFNLIHMNADQLSLFVRSRSEFLQGRYNIGYWNWELSSFPWEWYGKFRHLQEVWVPSQFTQESLAEVAPVPVTRIPYSLNLDTAPAPACTRAQLSLPADAFLFLFIFDFQSFVERKNPHGLVDAFQRAFAGRPDVRLVIKSSHSNFVEAEAKQLREKCRTPNIMLLEEVFPRDRLNALVSLCDAYVSLHRSEGFGFTMAEAMNLGKPVIATGYSANMDIMNASNSFPVRYKLVEIARDHGPYRAGAVWADPDLDHAAELMRLVLEDRQQPSLIARQGQRDVRKMLDPAIIGSMIEGRLRAIESRLEGRS